MVLVTVVELVTVVVISIVVESSPVDIGFTHMGAAV